MKVRSHHIAKLVTRTRSPQPPNHKDSQPPSAKPTTRPSLPRPTLRHVNSEKVITVATHKDITRPEEKLNRVKESTIEAKALIENRRGKAKVGWDNGRKRAEDDGDTTEETLQQVAYSAGEYQL